MDEGQGATSWEHSIVSALNVESEPFELGGGGFELSPRVLRGLFRM